MFQLKRQQMELHQQYTLKIVVKLWITMQPGVCTLTMPMTESALLEAYVIVKQIIVILILIKIPPLTLL